jgi:chromosome segregation protein
MRLKSIKLAGFKSFVDPTTIDFDSNLTAIVGPNGCGKSNVIDAIRWVMGESSAKNLRGEDMTDVIFNGSSSRKPVAQASIELIFDNTDGTVGGEYASYAEISVKRLVTRDAQSNYYLNGVKCRRKDITDIFLGTGLGPRSYAIIEQGMISRLVEAKPDELRVLIEEAAGISKYKERRRETENRMRRTRENLERLEDLREELGRQLDRLQRQAKNAEKYKEYKEEERLLKAQHQALKWRKINTDIQVVEARIRDLEVQFEAKQAERQAAETGIEKQRQLHTDLNDKFNDVQRIFYTIKSEITTIQQTIQHQKERHQQLHSDIELTDTNLKETTQHLRDDEIKINQLEESLQDIDPNLALLKEQETQSTEVLSQAEEGMQQWQVRWDEFNQSAAEPRRVSEVEQSKIQHLDQSIQRLGERIQRLQKEAENLVAGPIEKEMLDLQEVCKQQEQSVQELIQKGDSFDADISTLRDQNAETNNQLDSQRSSLQKAQGRHSSLEALQQAAMKQDGGLVKWLDQKGLASNKRLAESLKVDAGWEKAVETVLGDSLQAICCEGSFDPLAELASGLEHGELTLLISGDILSSDSSKGKLLSALVSNQNLLPSNCAAVYVAETLNDAITMRQSLAAHESVVSKDGVWIGSNWLKVAKDSDEQSGILAREQELKSLVSDIGTLQQSVQAASEKITQGREALKEKEQERHGHQTTLREASKRLSDTESELSARKARVEEFAARKESIDKELSECKSQLQSEQENLAIARQTLQDALDSMEKDSEHREALLKERDLVRSQLDQARDKARKDRDQAHLAVVQSETFRTQLSSTKEAMTRLQSQESILQERKAQLLEQLKEVDEPASNQHQELEICLEKQVTAQEQMTEARTKLDEAAYALREIEKNRNEAEASAQDVRGNLEKNRMEWQGFKVQLSTVQEQLDASNFERDKLLEDLTEDANISLWETDLERMADRIARLGQVNFSAIEEYDSESERKTYLDAQHADLIEALETLESAIRKIDKETRTRFKDTFEKLNSGLQEMFPKLLGGGHAYLELTGNELLDTGVTIMARPPGKRNTSIHLLSGGEKAMTAIALVFSIFKLNPAPFCILDEVDAPLDDANVGRYSRMVEEMSEQVQFIYITHNKVSMEMAHFLMGVTMHEPGCSRIVAVDVDEAAKMAAD